MRKYLPVLVVFAFFGMTFSIASLVMIKCYHHNATAKELSPPMSKWFSATVGISTQADASGHGMNGSGVYGRVGSRIGVLTAYHVVKGSEGIQIVTEYEDGESRLTAKVLYFQENQDLAFLVLPEGARLGLALSLIPVEQVVVLEDAWLVGSGATTRQWATKTQISRSPWKEKRDRCLEAGLGAIDGFLFTGGHYGSSGGPIFVERNGGWVLAGICSRWACEHPFFFEKGPLAAVGPDTIRSFLRRVEMQP